jgi:L-lactate dehydrogenase complex protein LldG
MTKDISAKAEILAAIRTNLAKSAPFDVVRSEHQPHQQAEIPAFKANLMLDQSPAAITQRFCENLESVGGKCTIVAKLNDASTALQTLINTLNPHRIALSDSPIVRSVWGQITTNAQILKNAQSHELFDCDLGITGAQWAIAETGTLVLESEREFSRLTSLVPEVHICILEAGNIRQAMGETLAILEKELSPTVTFITGPSRTSDIELTLAIGVHGPREVYVIVLDEQSGRVV